jgi:Asp-tRNA(Asn)/Glu-tRNA(Gln) amidotransferase A subunit family amidase
LEICFLTATELVRLVRAKELSALEVMEAHLAQIERVNPEVNAIVTLTAERAMDRARATDDAIARGEEVGLLCGLPVAHKDLFPTEGVRTTFGFLVYKDFVPDHDALIVERLRGAGAISVGKTNTPEFGAGSQTFNKIFGETLNPYDPTRTCGGSSGGGRWLWHAGWCRSPTAATWVVLCVTQRAFATWWASDLHRAGCRAGLTPPRGSRSRWMVPWPARSKMRP